MCIGVFRVWSCVCWSVRWPFEVFANRVVGNTHHVHIFARKFALFHVERGFNAHTCTFFRQGSGPFGAWGMRLEFPPAAAWYTLWRLTHVEQRF